jgi:hypothetical protein
LLHQGVDLFGGERIVDSGATEGCIIAPAVVYQGDKRGYHCMERISLHLYEICDPTRDPTKPASLQERMKADRVFKEVVAKVNEKYELIRV